jgi:hypothetical protein
LVSTAFQLILNLKVASLNYCPATATTWVCLQRCIFCPGVAFLVVYWFAARLLCRPWHLPSFLASLIAATFGVLLCQLGFLFYLGRWRNGRFALTGVVLYRQRLNLWKLALVTLIRSPFMVGLFL